MLNLPDATDPLEEAFNNGSRALAEMQENVEKMRVKFGEASKFYQRQKFLFDCLATMQEMSVKEINTLRHAYKLSAINQQAQTLVIESMKTGLSERQLLKWATQC